MRRGLVITQLFKIWRELQPQFKDAHQIRLSITNYLIMAAADTLVLHPRLNAAWHADRLRLYKTVNFGQAVSTERGLVVPVIRNTHFKNLAQIAAERTELADKAWENRLTLAELGGGTFTQTNLRMLGIDNFSPILNPPQSAILAVGKIAEKAMPENSRIVLRPTISLTLSADHRAVDGAQGAVFLAALVQLFK